MDDGRRKIALLDPDGKVETVWARAVAEGRYAIDNLPFFAYGISLADVVEATGPDGGVLALTRIVSKSGNRTLRTRLSVDEYSGAWTEESQELLAQLKALGCGIEQASRQFVAINVPAATTIEAVVAVLLLSPFDWEAGDPEDLPGANSDDQD